MRLYFSVSVVTSVPTSLWAPQEQELSASAAVLRSPCEGLNRENLLYTGATKC